jgi:parvulin-like peptidyl-prolyl isomerase
MAVATLALAAFGSAQIDPSKVVATVNGEPITGGEYYHRMEFMPGVVMNIGGQPVESTPGFFAVSQLIGEHLLYQLAKQKGLLPTSQEIEDELQLRLSDNPKLSQNMLDRGLSDADVRNMIKHDLTNFKLQTEGVTVTDQEVQANYKKNPLDYTRPKQYHVRLIAVKTDADTKAVDADLKSGKAFADVAKARSIDVTKATGGDLGTVPLDYFAPAVQGAISPLKIGSNTAWLPVGAGSAAAKVKYQVVDITPAKLLPLDKKLMTSARRLMMLRASNGKVDIKKEINDLRAKSKVTIALPQFQELWDQLSSAESGS